MVPKVLFIDDSQNFRARVGSEFAKEPYEVHLAADGRTGLELFHREHPDLVVTEIRLPDIDGIELMGRMLAQRPRLSVILYTAYGIYRSNYNCWAADAYLMKSSDLTELKEKIRELLPPREQRAAS